MREQRERQTVFICLVLSIFIIALNGCATVDVRPEILEAKKVRDQFFQENIDSYKPKTPDEGEVLKKIAENYKRAYETFNLELIRRILLPDFQVRYYFESDKVQIQDRNEFIRKRSKWRVKLDPDRKLLISIQASHHDEERNRYAFTVLTTYRSKYFNPRFLEVLVFEKREEWMLRRVLMYPMYPPRPELYEVKIFLGEYLTDRRKLWGLEEEINAEGPDVPFDKYLRLSKAASPITEVDHSPLVIIFSEPPPEGAKIEIYERQLTSGAETHQSTVNVRYYGNPFFYLTGYGWRARRGQGYLINVVVKINAVKVAEENLSIK